MAVRTFLAAAVYLLPLLSLVLVALAVAAAAPRDTDTVRSASDDGPSQAPPLGPLSPAPNLLPSGTVSVTLSLTSTLAANCRWSEAAGLPYVSMEHEFQQGQGTRQHGALVTGLHDLDDRRFYVRCQDLTGARDPDGAEASTHQRILGPWNDGYPHIANLWIEPSNLGAAFYAGYDLLMPYSWPGQRGLLDAIRSINPSIKILRSQYATKGRVGVDPLATEWWNSRPGDPGYACLLRDSHGKILLVDFWDNPMYNMTQSHCRQVVLERNLALFLSPRADEGNDLAYDGIYWDRLGGKISWLGPDIDADMDGQPDDPAILNAAYEAGLEDFIARLRAVLPDAVLVGNDATTRYASLLNGKDYEWQLSQMLNGAPYSTWGELLADIGTWMGEAQMPRTTFVQSAPEPFYADKYLNRPSQMPASMMAEAAASYQRMRYGLVTALMAGALFSYDYGSKQHGQPWWYDEYGEPGDGGEPLVPRRGYLGQPSAAPALLVDRLNTPDQVRNGDFANGLVGWQWWVDTKHGAAATLNLDASGGVSGAAAAHIAVTGPGERWSVELYQPGVGTTAGQSYTVSFWARSSAPRPIHFQIENVMSGSNSYEVEALLTPEWHHFHLSGIGEGIAPATGQMTFQVGGEAGELWLDDVQFQQGALGVWARQFLNGMAVINTTGEVQTAPLPGTLCKLNGLQAPLFQARLDDDQTATSAGWDRQPANASQFGPGVHLAAPGSGASITYTPTLAYGGDYLVSAWVVPTTTQSSRVPVIIRHAGGESTVILDETTGEVGWHSLGEYPLDAGNSSSITLQAGAQGITVADAVKWVSAARYNDGSQVNRVSLQPQDAIVLLRSCHRPAGWLHLPLILRH